MLYLVTYDVSHDALRKKLAKKLQEAGLERVQYSVFIGSLSSVTKEKIMTATKKIMEKESSFSVLMIPLHTDMLQRIEELASEPLDWEFLKGERKYMFF